MATISTAPRNSWTEQMEMIQKTMTIKLVTTIGMPIIGQRWKRARKKAMPSRWSKTLKTRVSLTSKYRLFFSNVGEENSQGYIEQSWSQNIVRGSRQKRVDINFSEKMRWGQRRTGVKNYQMLYFLSPWEKRSFHQNLKWNHCHQQWKINPQTHKNIWKKAKIKPGWNAYHRHRARRKKLCIECENHWNRRWDWRQFKLHHWGWNWTFTGVASKEMAESGRRGHSSTYKREFRRHSWEDSDHNGQRIADREE